MLQVFHVWLEIVQNAWNGSAHAELVIKTTREASSKTLIYGPGTAGPASSMEARMHLLFSNGTVGILIKILPQGPCACLGLTTFLNCMILSIRLVQRRKRQALRRPVQY